MKVEIWSDIACPWCYIGRRRFEKALARFDHRGQVEVIWRSYELDPRAPRQAAESIGDILSKKYGASHEETETILRQTARVGAQEGLDLRFDRVQAVNTFDAHRLLQFAAQHGAQSDLSDRLHKAYFTEGLSVSDHETLVRLAVETGLDADETRQMLNSDAYADDVRADMRRGTKFGSQGVPFFVFDERYAVSGAQQPEVFLGALERAWADARPAIKVIGASEASGMCDDTACAT